jgi:putative redox protein
LKGDGNVVETQWKGGMSFEAHTPDGKTVLMDVPGSDGAKGASPKILLIAGLTGCTGMDTVSILEKMKISDYQLRIEADYHTTDEHPKIYDRIHLRYCFSFSKEPPKENVRKAVELSQTKYCGVSAMLKKAAAITWEIVFE